MKKLLVAVIPTLCLPLAAGAQCVSTFELSNTSIFSLLNANSVASPQTCNNTSCSNSGTMTWVHSGTTNNNESIVGTLAGGGNFYEYKLGPGHPNDPPAQLGTWTITGTTTGQINYIYTGGTTYSYNIQSPTTTLTGVSAARTGGSVTLTFSPSQSPVPSGPVIVSGFTGGGTKFNVTATTTAWTATTVTFGTANNGATSATGGTIQFATPSPSSYSFCETSPGTNTYTVTITNGSP